MVLLSEGHIEIDLSGFPVFGDFHEDSGDEPQERRLVGEERGDTGASFDLFVEVFDHVGCTHAFSVSRRQDKDREAIRKVGFDPLGEFGRRLAVLGDGVGEPPVGLGPVWGVEHVAQVCGDLLAHGDLGDVLHGVLL